MVAGMAHSRVAVDFGDGGIGMDGSRDGVYWGCRDGGLR